MSRIDLRVPFEQKDEAKRLGARWDAAAKVWYVPAGKDVAPFRRWLPRQIDPNDIGVRAEEYYIAEGNRACWKCGQSTRVFCFLLPVGHEILSEEGEYGDEELYTWQRNDAPTMMSYVTNLTPGVVEKLRPFGDIYRLNRSETTQSQYWMNHCENCGAKQGDFQLHSEPGGAFFPMDEEAAAQIALHHVAEPFGCQGDTGYGSPVELLWDRVSSYEEPRSQKHSFLSRMRKWALGTI
jgi:hypothetical protein